MKISDLQPKTAVDELIAKVTEKGEPRDVKGGALKLCECTLQDDSGTTTLALWNNDIETVNVGDTVKITKGWTNEFQGKMSISSGRFGKLEVIESAGGAEGAGQPVPEDIQEAYDNDII